MYLKVFLGEEEVPYLRLGDAMLHHSQEPETGGLLHTGVGGPGQLARELAHQPVQFLPLLLSDGRELRLLHTPEIPSRAAGHLTPRLQNTSASPILKWSSMSLMSWASSMKLSSRVRL